VKSTIEIRSAKHALRARMGWHWGGDHTRNWHGLPHGVLGVGFGVKRQDGKAVADDCIRVYVTKKRGARDLSRRQRVPKKIDGYFTDVIALKQVRTHQGPGGSISNSQGLMGSLGCVVSDSDGDYLLGSWHVFTNTDGKDGDPVFMPSKSVDGNAPIVGTLIATPIFHLNGGENAFDASVARLQAGIQMAAALDAGRPFTACCGVNGSSAVVKRGAATAQTQGTVDGASEDIVVMYNGMAAQRAVLTGQIAIVGTEGGFSDEGDSGALVCTPDLGPIGLIVGGSVTQPDSPLAHSFASPIGPILDFYQVSIKS
jgi:hypothetical protein